MMKTFTIVLSTLAVLATMGSVFAESEFMYTGNNLGEATYLGNGLLSYTIYIKGTTAFEDVRITDGWNSEGLCGVHQMNMNMGTYAMDTIYTPFSPLPGTNAQGYDTRFAFALSDLAMGNPAPDDPTVDGVETSNFVDTYGIGTQDYIFLPGIGTFDTDMMALAIYRTSPFFTMKDTFTPFIQIVCPEGTGWFLKFTYIHNQFTDVNNQTLRDACITNTPEPGTILMLVLGALCLVGYRLRKWVID